MILETQKLTKRYGSRTVLNAIDLSIAASSIYGLVGPNGAGKTTLLSIIAGLRRPTSGKVLLTIDKHQVAVCPDVPEFEPWLTAREVLELSANLVDKPMTRQRVNELITEAGLGDSATRKVGSFSRGMTQRLALAATIIGNPAFVILDEPCSALDPAGRVEVLDMISRMAKHATIIFSTHILADVQRTCKQIGVLDKGNMLYQGSLDSFLEENTKPIWNVTLRSGMENVKSILAKHAWVVDLKNVTKEKLQVTGRSIEEIETQLIQVLASANAQVVAIEPVEGDLEHAFLSLTQAYAKDEK